MSMKTKNPTLAIAIALTLPLLAGCGTSREAGEQASQATPATLPAVQPAAQAQVAAAPVAPAQADAARLLPLQGVLNARHPGGLQGRVAPVPATAFLRTADLGGLTEADRDALAAAGVRLDIDLRTADEEVKSHDLLADDPRFDYRRISLLGEEKIDLNNLPDALGPMYAQALDASQPQFRDVFQAIAAQRDGTVLFHCTAGKDRTGMVAALLLDLAGVSRQDIVHNYAISAHYLKPMMAQMAQRHPEMVEMAKRNPKILALQGTPPEAMEQFLDKLHAEYGGAEAYLRSIGLDEAQIQPLMARMGQKG